MQIQGNRIIKTFIAFTIAAIVVFGIFLAILDYLNLPLVAFTEDEDCVWVELVEDNKVHRLECPLQLPARYTKQYVWIKDVTGEW